MSSQINVIINSGSIVDLSMTPIARGRITFRATDANDKSLPITVAGGKQAINEDVSLPITNGSMSGALTLPHPANSYPTNYRLRITIWDSATNKQTVYRNVAISDDGGGNWNFTNWLSTQSSTIPLPTAPGPAGMNWRGAWTANTAYAFRDALIYNGSAYYVTTGFTSGATFDATNLSLLASAGSFSIGSVTTAPSGSSASATLTGTAPNQSLNLTLPAGPQIPTLPVYASSSVGLSFTTSGAYFFASPVSGDNVYDVWQNSGGMAVLAASVPKQAVFSIAQSPFRLRDTQGFIFDFWSAFQSLQSKMTTVQTYGLTLGATQGDGLNASNNTNGAFFLVPATSPDNAYDVFKNVFGTPVFQLSLQKQAIVSGSNILAVRDQQGFGFTVVDGSGNIPAMNAPLAARDLTLAVHTLNESCMSYSRKVQATCRIDLASPEYQYNYMPWYGQSLSVGYQTLAVLSTAAKYGNLSLGNSLLYNNGMMPVTDNLFHSLIERAASAQAETECSGMCNTAKRLLNNHRNVANDTARTFVTNSLGHPGVPIAMLIPTAPVDTNTSYPSNYWTAVTNFLTKAAAAAALSSNGASGVGTIGSTGFFYCQGENNSTDQQAGDPQMATYLSEMLAIRSAYDSACQSILGQSPTKQAGFYTYQTGAQWASDANQLAIENIQWIMAITQPNFFMFGPHHAYPDLGGHLTSNSYRWLGAMAGKVWFRTAVMRQGWQPLAPVKVNMFDSKTLLVGFHVPVPPLTVATAYSQSVACNFPDMGFTLLDGAGFVNITVSIVADQVVKIVASRAVDWTTAILRYADQATTGGAPTPHYGTGNLCDSDPALADDIYVASANQSGTPDGTAYDYAGLVGNPYPLMNWCIGFQLRPNTFNSTGPVVG